MLKLSDFVGYLDATNRIPERTAAVAARVDIAAAEVEAAATGNARPGGPIVAVVASMDGNAAAVVTAAGSREKDLRN